MELLEFVLFRYRSWFVTLFLLPMSLVFDCFWAVRNYITFTLNSAPQKHGERVAAVQMRVRQWQSETGGKIPMCTGRPGWTTMSLRVGKYKQTHFKVDLSLRDILELDEQKRTVRVEPLVTMAQLTALLLPKGWTIPVVPELDELTVGGLINGFGVETSSFRHGLFQHTCKAFEIVLATGDLVRCTPQENADLFYAIPWSHGTLGFLVAAELAIVPAKRFVKVTYLPFRQRAPALECFERHSRDVKNKEVDFVEALMFSLDDCVVMLGQMTDDVPAGAVVNPVNGPTTPWFYTHVRSFLAGAPKTQVEYVPLRHYYHRHSKSLFWEMESIVPVGNHPLYRHLLGWMMPPKVALLKLTQPKALQDLYEKRHVDQDLLVPMRHLEASITEFHRLFQVYPLWLCPMLIPRGADGFVHPACDGDELFVDVGLYGEPRAAGFHARTTTRAAEELMRKWGGFQALYADSYQTRDELREMFDHSKYDAARAKYKCAGAFPEVFDKVNKAARA